MNDLLSNLKIRLLSSKINNPDIARQTLYSHKFKDLSSNEGYDFSNKNFSMPISLDHSDQGMNQYILF